MKEREKSESGGKRYGNVITTGSPETLVGGDEGNKGGKEKVPKHYSPQVQSFPSLSTLSMIQLFILSDNYSSLSMLGRPKHTVCAKDTLWETHQVY